MLCFGEFELDTERFELRRGGRACRIEPKVFDLIAYFAAHPAQVLTRDELIAAVWTGRIVSDTTVSTCIKGARKALGDSGESQTWIKTLRGRGFSFAGEVTEGPAPVQPARALARDADAKIPALRVATFRAISTTAAATELAGSLGHDLGTILTRIPLLRVATQGAESIASGETPSARQLHEAYGVDYVLGATVQQLGDHFRVNAQLSDAVSGFQLWAGQFSIAGPLADAIEHGASTIVGKLEPQLHRAIYNTVREINGPPNARQLFLEASSLLATQGWRFDTFATAAELLRRSCALQPHFALAPAYLSLVLGLGERIGMTSDREAARAEALEAAELALRLDSMDDTVLGFAGCALADIGYPERARPILQNAVELNPANAQAWAALGSACLLLGQTRVAIDHLQHGIAISPLDSRLSIWGALLTLALLSVDDLEGALRQGALACQRDDRNYMPRIALAAAHLARGDSASAHQSMRDAHRIRPDLSHSLVASFVGNKLAAALAALGEHPRTNAD